MDKCLGVIWFLFLPNRGYQTKIDNFHSIVNIRVQTNSNLFMPLVNKIASNTRFIPTRDVNPAKNNETQQRKGTQDRSMDRFEWKTLTRCLWQTRTLI
jgi:hypothetical protein